MTKIDKIFITFLLLLQVNFFDIFPLGEAITNSVSGYSQKKLMLVVIILYCIVSKLMTIHSQSTLPSFFGLSIFLLVAMVIAITFLSAKIYNQSIVSTFLTSYYFLIILLYYPIRTSLKNSEAMYWLVTIVSKFGFWMALIKIVQSGVKSFVGINVFSLNASVDAISLNSMRFTFLHFVRLPSASDFVFFSLILLMIGSFIFKGRFTGLKFWTVFAVDIFYILIIGQTRMYIGMTAVVVAVMLFINLRSGDKSNNLILFIIFVIVGGVVTVFLISRIDLTNGDRAVSLTIRRDAINYFMSNINYNGFYGFGFARDDLYGFLIHGSTTLRWGGIIQSGYNYDDVGIFGFLAIFGYLSIPFFIIFLSQALKSILESKFKLVSLLTLLFIIMSLGSISLFNPQRIMYLPFYLAILCWLAKVNGGKNETCS
jgi:hypothetical protein